MMCSSIARYAVENADFLDDQSEEVEDGFIELVALIEKLTEEQKNDEAL